MRVKPIAIGAKPAPFVEIAPAHRGIALFEQALVARGLRQDRGHGFGPALRLIAAELAIVAGAVPDRHEPRGQIHRIVEPAIEAEPAQGIIDVRRVAGQEHPAVAIGFRHALADR